MNVEQEISTICLEMYDTCQLFTDQKAKGYITYDPVLQERASQIMNRDCLNAIYKLADDLPSLHRLDVYRHKPQNYEALKDLAYTFHNVRFRGEQIPALEKAYGNLNKLLLEFKRLSSNLGKDTTEISLEEAKAMAWDSLPGINEQEQHDYIALISNPFDAEPDPSFRNTRTDRYLYKFRFFKTYINGVCVGWEFFGQE